MTNLNQNIFTNPTVHYHYSNSLNSGPLKTSLHPVETGMLSLLFIASVTLVAVAFFTQITLLLSIGGALLCVTALNALLMVEMHSSHLNNKLFHLNHKTATAEAEVARLSETPEQPFLHVNVPNVKYTLPLVSSTIYSSISAALSITALIVCAVFGHWISLAVWAASTTGSLVALTFVLIKGTYDGTELTRPLEERLTSARTQIAARCRESAILNNLV